MNGANWNLEAHSAASAEGILGAGLAGCDPSRPERHRRRRQDSLLARGAREARRESRGLAEVGSRDELLFARRSARHVPAVPVPDRARRRQRSVHLYVRERQPAREHGRADRAARRHVDGTIERPLGRRHVGRRDDGVQRPDAPRPGGQPSFERAEGHRTLHAAQRQSHLQYSATLEDANTYSRPWTISMPLYRHVEPNAQLLEFKCVPFVEELLYKDLELPPAVAARNHRIYQAIASSGRPNEIN